MNIEANIVWLLFALAPFILSNQTIDSFHIDKQVVDAPTEK